jgi:hypothetical protein
MTFPIAAIILSALLTTPAPAAPAHVTHSFRFNVHAPLAVAAPLFGPAAERAWAGKHWQPAFIYPQPDKDIQGAVFTVPHGPLQTVWVNTIFDLANGRMQYVVFIPGIMVNVIDVRLTPAGDALTSAEITYTRTALDASANEDVVALGEEDTGSGPEWEKSIAEALSQPKPVAPAPAQQR